MKKEFDKWNIIKKDINDNESSRLYHAREIWWCAFGLNVGFEQDGNGEKYQRPVLILKGFSKQTCLVAPLTTSEVNHKMRVDIGKIAGENSKVIISQLKVVDTKRFTEKIGFLDKEKFENIIKIIKDML